MDGDIYEGEYNPKSKIIEGNGIYYFNHGPVYKGHFEKNIFSGKGKYFYDEIIMSGIFKNGKLNGKGEIMKGENTLKGEFKDGKKEGIFLFYDITKNKTTRRLYENNILIKEEKN